MDLLPIVFYSIPFACLLRGVWHQELGLALLGIAAYATQLWVTARWQGYCRLSFEHAPSHGHTLKSGCKSWILPTLDSRQQAFGVFARLFQVCLRYHG